MFLLSVLLVALARMPAAGENELSAAGTEIKQAEMRLQAARSELKEKRTTSRESEAGHQRDKAKLEGLQKEMAKLEVSVESRVRWCRNEKSFSAKQFIVFMLHTVKQYR